MARGSVSHKQAGGCSFFKMQTLALCGMIALSLGVFIAHDSWHDTRPSDTRRRNSIAACYQLTTELTEDIVKFGDVQCQQILAEPFDMAQWRAITAEQRQRLRRGESHDLDGFTNNNSVNIFHNHVRLWNLASKHRDPVLIVEDDVYAAPDFGANLGEALGLMPAGGYLLKLHNHWSYGPTVSCMCQQSPFLATSTAAYVIHPRLAQWILPRVQQTTHVDIWMWEQACIQRQFPMFTTNNLVLQNHTKKSRHRCYDCGGGDFLEAVWILLGDIYTHMKMAAMVKLRHCANTEFEASVRPLFPAGAGVQSTWS